MFHFMNHAKFLQKSEEEKRLENDSRSGRPTTFSKDQLKMIIDFVRKETSEDKLVLFEDIDRFVFSTLGIEICEMTIRTAIKAAGIKLVVAKPAERQRRELDPHIIEKYFEELKCINGTPSSLVINLDESGQQDWVDRRSQQCYVPSDHPSDHMTYSVDRSSHRSTSLVGIALSGKLLKPLIVVKRSTIDSELVELGYARSAIYATSRTAFVNTELYHKWMLEVVVPHIRKNRLRERFDGPAFVIQDGFGGHDVELISDQLKENNIKVITLPPHSSHLLQPLDIGVFGVQKFHKNRMKLSIESLSEQTVAVVKIIDSLRRATSPIAIINAFKACGITTTLVNGPVSYSTLALVDATFAKKAQCQMELMRTQPVETIQNMPVSVPQVIQQASSTSQNTTVSVPQVIRQASSTSQNTTVLVPQVIQQASSSSQPSSSELCEPAKKKTKKANRGKGKKRLPITTLLASTEETRVK